MQSDFLFREPAGGASRCVSRWEGWLQSFAEYLYAGILRKDRLQEVPAVSCLSRSPERTVRRYGSPVTMAERLLERC